MSPAVSIIIPTFRRPAPALAAARSALAQTCSVAFEIVLVDNDPSGSAMGPLRALADPRVTVVHEPAAGVANARNAGLRMARGDIAIRAQLPKDDPDHLSQGQALREIRKLQVEAKKASDAVQNFGQPSRSTTPAPQNAPATSPANGGFRILKVE